jgi:hypothetical protein
MGLGPIGSRAARCALHISWPFAMLLSGQLIALHNPLEIRLREPTLAHGVLSTELGGVLEQGDLRIQAQRIVYSHSIGPEPLSLLRAEGDLAVELGGRLFVGQRLAYDFLTREGEIEGGRTQYGPWYLEGSRILLHADGSFEVVEATLSTSENQRPVLSLNASQLLLRRGGALSAENLRVQLFNLPLVWFPKLKATLRSLPRFPVQLKWYWRGPQGPMASMRYRLSSWKGGYLGLRLDYILKRGWGGAVELTHQSPDKSTRILSRNYLVTDDSLNNPCKRKRFRVEGLMQTRWRDGHTSSYLQWDKLSDKAMASDYPESYFDLQVPMRTEFYNVHSRENFLVNLDGRLRLNNFQSINQLLPAGQITLLPSWLAPVGGLFESPFRGAFQDYKYAVCTPVPGFSSGRVSYCPRLSVPIACGPLSLVGGAGFNGVFYSDSPAREPVWVTQGAVQAEGHLPLERAYAAGLHRLEPFLRWSYTSSPGLPFGEQYLFDIQDGFQQLSILRPGLITEWRPWSSGSGRRGGLERLRAQLYADAFLVNSPYSNPVPKAFLDLDLRSPTLAFELFAGWDFVHHLVDTFNLQAGWTLSEDLAIKAEFRHRSPWAWRKCDFDNYVLDCSVSPDSLVCSPLSDPRNAISAQAFVRLTPMLSARFQAYANWGRPCEPPNSGLRADLFALLVGNLMVKCTAEITNLENRFAINLALTNTSQSPRPLNPFKVVR